MENTKAQALYTHAKQVIPGGTQLLSKRPEQYAPDQWPNYFTKAKGCEVWDVDGRHYYDMTTNGIASCLLGFADPDVTAAVIKRELDGSMSSLNAPEEVELADKLCEIHPWANSVRFARTGGETAAVAIRIARATTGRDVVAICGYHGWSDWYLAANLGPNDALRGVHLAGLEPAGVPSGLRDTAFTFRYDNKEEFDAILDKWGDRLAAVIMEPVRNVLPEGDFLSYVRDGAHRVGALLIYDEITIGWRWTFGGSHLKLGVTPDMAIFAKSLGNGHPIGAVIGTREAMDGAQKSFISSTYWTESIGPAAALATLKKMEETRVWEYIPQISMGVRRNWETAAAKYKLPVKVPDILPCWAQFSFTEFPLELKTLYTVLMLKKGFLGTPALDPTLAHTPAIVALYGEAIDEVFAEMSEIYYRAEGDARRKQIVDAIGGPVCYSGFARLVK